MKKLLICVALLATTLLSATAQDNRSVPEIRGDKPLSVRMAESEMNRIPDAVYMDGVKKPKWNYTTGLELLSIVHAGDRYQSDAFEKYALDWVNTMARASRPTNSPTTTSTTSAVGC